MMKIFDPRDRMITLVQTLWRPGGGGLLIVAGGFEQPHVAASAWLKQPKSFAAFGD